MSRSSECSICLVNQKYLSVSYDLKFYSNFFKIIQFINGKFYFETTCHNYHVCYLKTFVMRSNVFLNSQMSTCLNEMASNLFNDPYVILLINKYVRFAMRAVGN